MIGEVAILAPQISMGSSSGAVLRRGIPIFMLYEARPVGPMPAAIAVPSRPQVPEFPCQQHPVFVESQIIGYEVLDSNGFWGLATPL